MKSLLKFLFAGWVLAATPAIAADWVSITTNTVGDKFFVDKSSIQRKGDVAWFWEYREFPQPNNAFLQETVDQPLHGVVINWSVDCAGKTQRMRQVTAYNKEKKVIQRFSYGEEGVLLQPRSGSSAAKVVDFVCTPPSP